MSNQRITALQQGVSAKDSRVADVAINTEYPSHTQFSFFAIRIVFQSSRKLFLLRCCLCVSLPSTTEGGFFGTGPQSTEHTLLMLASPRMRRRKIRARLPRLQMRNVCYNKTSRRSGCALFLTRLSSQRITAIQQGVSAKRFTRCRRVPKGSADRHRIPRAHSIQFFCKKNHISEQRKFFPLGGCLCVSLPSTIEGSFFQYRARLRSTPYACKRFWETQTKNIV